MRHVRLNNAKEVIQACLTEDKQYCLDNGGSSVLHLAINNCVDNVLAQLVPGVYCFRIETNDGVLAGFSVIHLLEERRIVSVFIRPIMRAIEAEIMESVRQVKNSMLKPVV